jgi:hypothetical protein
MKKRALLLCLLLAIAASAQSGFWAFNQFLYFEYISNPAAYAQMVADGDACYAWVGGGTPDSQQPGCFYDPSNTNSGVY